jgi:hypothetical protein
MIKRAPPPSRQLPVRTVGSARHWLVRKNRRENDHVLLEEYKAVRAEVTTSMQAQISVLAFGAATLGFSFAAASQTSNAKFRDMFLLVLVPLLCYLILTVWFAEVMRMLRAGTFLMRLEKRLDEEFGYGALTWESTVFQGRCERGAAAFLLDPDRFRMLAIGLLFLTIAVTSIVIGWGSVSLYAWQHWFAIAALLIAVAVLVWLYVLRSRQVHKLASPLLREGAEGEEVKHWQRELSVAGFYKDEIDGWFGPKTTAAVCKLQAENGLEDDGVIGLMTLDLLDDLAYHRSVAAQAERTRRLPSLSRSGGSGRRRARDADGDEPAA